jgi:hypothetical protein
MLTNMLCVDACYLPHKLNYIITIKHNNESHYHTFVHSSFNQAFSTSHVLKHRMGG